MAILRSATDREIGVYFDRCARDGVLDGFTPEEEERVTAVLEEWALGEGDHVLEPGCGSGRLTELLARAVGTTGEVLAFDLSAAMIERARRRRLPTQVRLEQASASAVPAPDASIDIVVCLNVLPHFTDKAEVFAELARVLRPHGRLWINHLAGRDQVNAFHRGLDPVVRDHQIPPERELRRLLEKAGFAVELVEDEPEGYRLQAIRRTNRVEASLPKR